MVAARISKDTCCRSLQIVFHLGMVFFPGWFYLSTRDASQQSSLAVQSQEDYGGVEELQGTRIDMSSCSDDAPPEIHRQPLFEISP